MEAGSRRSRPRARWSPRWPRAGVCSCRATAGVGSKRRRCPKGSPRPTWRWRRASSGSGPGPAAFSRRAPAAPWRGAPFPGTVVSLAGDGVGGVVALAVDETGRPATLVRGRADGRSGLRGRSSACGSPGRVAWRPRQSCGVRRRLRPGRHRRPRKRRQLAIASRWEGRVTALAVVDDLGTLVAATYSEADDTTGLVRLDCDRPKRRWWPGSGPSRDDAEADGRTLALAFDDPRGVVWVAGGFGVAAFAIR